MLNVRSNISGNEKLPINLIGKAQRPRCFKGTRIELLPVKYSDQSNAWRTSRLSISGFINTSFHTFESLQCRLPTTIHKSWQKIIPLTTTPSDNLKLTAIGLFRVHNLSEILVDALHEGYDQQMDQAAIIHVSWRAVNPSPIFFGMGLDADFRRIKKTKMSQ